MAAMQKEFDIPIFWHRKENFSCQRKKLRCIKMYSGLSMTKHPIACGKKVNIKALQKSRESWEKLNDSEKARNSITWLWL